MVSISLASFCTIGYLQFIELLTTSVLETLALYSIYKAFLLPRSGVISTVTPLHAYLYANSRPISECMKFNENICKYEQTNNIKKEIDGGTALLTLFT